MGPRAGLDGCGKSRPYRGFDPRTVQTVSPCLSFNELTCCCGVCVLERHTVFGSGQKCVCVCVCVCVYRSDTPCLVLARSVCVLLSKPTAHSTVLYRTDGVTASCCMSGNHTGNMFRCSLCQLSARFHYLFPSSVSPVDSVSISHTLMTSRYLQCSLRLRRNADNNQLLRETPCCWKCVLVCVTWWSLHFGA